MKKVRFYSMGILAVLLLFVTGIILSFGTDRISF